MTPAARRLERSERKRRELLARLEGLDDARLNRPPADGGWSIVQVLCHLCEAERLSLEYLRKKTSDPAALLDAGLGARMRTALLRLALGSPFRFKAPVRSAAVPDFKPVAEAVAEWDAVREGWRQLVEAFPPELQGKAVYRHPYAGMMTLAQAVAFVEAHLERHCGQIERLLAS